jgi:hypothetical protein
MTLSFDCVTQNFPSTIGMAVGSTVIVRDVPASSNRNGVTTLEIVRLTNEYCKVREAV